MDTGIAAELLAATGGGIALVAGITQAIKVLAFPTHWQNGRAPMVLAALLSIAVVFLGGQSIGLSFGAPDALLALAAGWLAVYTGAIGAHQTVTKAGRVASGTTNPTGPDDGAPGEHGHG